MDYLCLALGVWLLFLTWGGAVPNGHVMWGKDHAGQKMRLGQRILFGVGGIVFLGLGVLFYFVRTKRLP